MRLLDLRVFGVTLGLSVILLIAVAASFAGCDGGGDGDSDSGTINDGDTPPPHRVDVEVPPAIIEVVNTARAPVSIHRNNERQPVLELVPHEIGRIELVRDVPVQLYVDDAEALGIRHGGIEFTPQGPVRYVWDLQGRGRYVHSGVRRGEPSGRIEPPHPQDRYERRGVYVFRVDYGLLDATTEIEPRAGRAPRKIYRQLASASTSEIRDVTAEQLDMILHRQPEAYLPVEQAALVSLAVQAWPDDYGMRLLRLVRLGHEVVIRAVTEELIRRPDPSLAQHLRDYLIERGAESVPEPERRAYVRILATCGTMSDLEAVWQATTHHVGRRHMITALKGAPGSPPAVEFFLRRLLSEDANLVHEAWEFLLRPEVLRDPMVLSTTKLHIETDWTNTQDSRDRQYRRLLNAAFQAVAISPHYPPELVDWLMLETLHRLDPQQARVAIEHFADKQAEGIRVLHESYPYLPASKRRDVIARPLLDRHELYPELEALLFDALNDRYWEDIARPALHRLLRHEKMREQEFRTTIRKRIDEIERPYNRYRALSLYQAAWRTVLANNDPESLGITEEQRREQLLEWILHGVDSHVARHSFESLWEVLEEDDQRAELLLTLVANYDKAGPDNRAIILYTLIDHVRLARDHDREPWVDELVVRDMLVAGLEDAAPAVREIAFGTLVMDRHWYREPHLRMLLDEAVLWEPRSGRYDAFRAMLLVREAREAGHRVRAGDRVAREFLATLLQSQYDEVATAAIDGLALSGCNDAIDLLALQYFSLSPPMRKRALQALAGARTLVFEIFAEAARSESISERRAAYRALLARLDRTSDDYLEAFLDRLIANENDSDLRDDFKEWRKQYRIEPKPDTMPSW